MAELIKGVLVDVEKGTAGVVEIEKSLDGYYKAIDTDCIDVVTRRIGSRRYNRVYSIVCDDFGLFRDDLRISAINSIGGVALVGNLFICNEIMTENGLMLAGLTDEDCSFVLHRVAQIGTRKHPEPYFMLTQVEEV